MSDRHRAEIDAIRTAILTGAPATELEALPAARRPCAARW